jgi:hypothetical protein
VPISRKMPFPSTYRKILNYCMALKKLDRKVPVYTEFS